MLNGDSLLKLFDWQWDTRKSDRYSFWLRSTFPV